MAHQSAAPTQTVGQRWPARWSHPTRRMSRRSLTLQTLQTQRAALPLPTPRKIGSTTRRPRTKSQPPTNLRRPRRRRRVPKSAVQRAACAAPKMLRRREQFRRLVPAAAGASASWSNSNPPAAAASPLCSNSTPPTAPSRRRPAGFGGLWMAGVGAGGPVSRWSVGRWSVPFTP